VGDLFSKDQFHINLETMTATWPTTFKAAICASCPQRVRCTKAKKKGRTVQTAKDERLQQNCGRRQLSSEAATVEGIERLRDRVVVEHALAHIGQRQGIRARYFGARDNLLDLRRAASVQNLELTQRKAP
jgi:hypothetical protein